MELEQILQSDAIISEDIESLAHKLKEQSLDIEDLIDKIAVLNVRNTASLSVGMKLAYCLGTLERINI